MLTGSLGMLPSATIGGTKTELFNPAIYEPIHGSAPDIAGKGIANPMAQILSVAMMLRLSLGMPKQAAQVEQACIDALAAGARTPDLGGDLSTAQVGDAVLAQLECFTSSAV
jgi:3-isopropylmalate dehydrogenase